MLIGLVGKPSVGKSTFFKAATLMDVTIAPHPFTTIKPNRGVGYVEVDCIDREFGVQCNPSHGFCINGKRFVPVELMDVAGLVPGASEGKGLGNKFLDDLRQADAFIQIIDISGMTDAEGKMVLNGDYNPANDIEFLEDELNKWYNGILERVWRSFARKAELEEANFAEAVAKQFSGLKINTNQVKEVLRKLEFKEKPSIWSEQQMMFFSSELRKQTKPMIIAANKIDMKNGRKNYEKIKKEFSELKIIPCSADSELALKEASKKRLIEYIPGEKNFKVMGELNEFQKSALDKIKENVLDFYESTGVQNVLNEVVFNLLSYIAVFPASPTKMKDSKGRVLPDCFLIPQGSTALDFAFFLHTDFGKNFIRAIDARTKKALGKDYQLKNRDALEIITSR
ncbi:redox-regulated ATPase YchF [Candidatus Pacearchaeota archaeon]|nr:redox-regulated ATPase YchF [Candidatus Pacearchaeota archaeon]